MNNPVPKKITRPKPYLIKSEWSDGFKSTIKLEKLRAECPCAQCGKEREKKQSGGDGMFGMQMLNQYSEGMNELVSLKPQGNYALKAEWGDGHDTGIYTFQVLRMIFEKHKLSDEEIKEMEEKFG